MKYVTFIRHGSVIGNELKQYIGRTDQPLSEKGVSEAKALKEYFDSRAGKYHHHDGYIFVSPKIRCMQTADILFPDEKKEYVRDLSECNFGIFEGRSYDSLQKDTQYQIWLNSDCKRKIPEGEMLEEFIDRCTNAFISCMENVPDEGYATFVVHGGTVMSIFSRLLEPHKDFFDTVVDNCTEIKCTYDNGILKQVKACEKFYQNKDCKYFPCHETDNVDNFNCLFCYCPLYFMGDKCGGNFKLTATGKKNCEGCTRPHDMEAYDEIISLLKKNM